MYLTYTVYVLILALFIWGGKFAGFKKDQFHEDSSSLESMKSLRGFAAIGVILHHISQESAFQWAGGGYGKPGELSIFVNAGYLVVAIFFFCSGYGLIKSLETKPDYLNGFMKKRVLKTLVIPYYVSIAIYGILRFLSGEEMPAAQWITNIIGITMMNEYAWYPIIAAILYTAFYLIFKNIKNQKVCYTLMAVIIVALGVGFCFNGHFVWWAGPRNWWLNEASELHNKWWTQQKIFWLSGEWWINSCPALFIGMLFAHNETKIRDWFRKAYWGKFVTVLLITFLTFGLSTFGQMKFGWWTEFSGNGPDIAKKLATYPFQITFSMMFPILIFTIMLKCKTSNPVSRFFGKYSLETYMMNLIPLTAFRFLIYKPNEQWGNMPFYNTGHSNLAVYFAAVFVCTILLGMLYKYLCGLLQKRI